MSSNSVMHKPYSFQDLSVMKKILECKKNYDIAEIEIRGIKERVNSMKDTKDTAAPFFLQLREAEQNMERWNIIQLMTQVAADDFKQEIKKATKLYLYFGLSPDGEQSK